MNTEDIVVDVPAKSVSGLSSGLQLHQSQACPPMSRPPPSITKSCISCAFSSQYTVDTNTLRSSVKSVFRQLSPDGPYREGRSVIDGWTPTTPFLPWSNHRRALCHKGTNSCGVQHKLLSLLKAPSTDDGGLCASVHIPKQEDQPLGL